MKQLLESLLSQNTAVYSAIRGMEALTLPNAYISAGCVAQTVWNHLHGYPSANGIADFDIVYYNEEDLSEDAEMAEQKRVSLYFSGLPLPVDVINEARVHLWYEQAYGFTIPPYRSTEDAIDSWPSTATAIGVRLEGGRLHVYAPFGLSDLFAGIIRPNKKLITREIYEKKARVWHEKWPNTKVIPW